jgi:hypothetical protein
MADATGMLTRPLPANRVVTNMHLASLTAESPAASALA